MNSQSKTGAVMSEVRSRVNSRTLTPGEKLPSIRQFAKTMGVAPSTVVEAYDRLAAEGLIRSRPGSGFFVSGHVAPFVMSEVTPELDRAIDPLWVSRQSLDAHADMLKPGCGWLPADWMPNSAIRKAMRNLAKSDAALLSDYGSTRGGANLRRLLAHQLADEGLSVDLDQVLLTASGTQAIDLLCRFLVRPGDTVIVDDPCYFNFQALLKAHQVKVVGVPVTPQGPDVEGFETLLRQHNPRLYITNSALQNPTGATLTPNTAHRILTAASEHDLIIVEDDIFAAYEPEMSTRLAPLDGLERVIRIGSFSKTLSASVRCGYVVAKRDWIDSLVDLQVATNFGGPSPVAVELIHSVLSDGRYRKHMESVRSRLTRLREETTIKLAKLEIHPWLMPRGGFYLWCRLPGDIDSADLAKLTLRENVVLAPGNVFSPSQSKSSFMRFNVSQMEDIVIFDVLARGISMCRQLHEQT